MFAFQKTKTVRRKVTINVPRDGEGFDQATCFVTFEILPNDDSKNAAVYDKGHFRRVVTNIEELQDADSKQPITFTKEFLEDFLAVDYVMAALVREYINCTVAAGRGN